MTTERSIVELPAGSVEYTDSGGAGPTVVFLGGVFMDDSLWAGVVPRLDADHRCIVPILPLGGHRVALRSDADRSMAGLAQLVADLLAALGLTDVVLVGADHGLAQAVAADHPSRLRALVLLPMEAFDSFPPGLPGKVAGIVARLPGGVFLAAQQLRFGWFQRSPVAFGRMTQRGIPADVVRAWTEGARRDRAVRRDVERYVRDTPKDAMARVAERLAAFDRPALVVWAPEDRVMDPSHGRRLADILPQGRLVELRGTGTLVAIDRPDDIVRLVREVTVATGPRAGTG